MSSFSLSLCLSVCLCVCVSWPVSVCYVYGVLIYTWTLISTVALCSYCLLNETFSPGGTGNPVRLRKLRKLNNGLTGGNLRKGGFILTYSLRG